MKRVALALGCVATLVALALLVSCGQNEPNRGPSSIRVMLRFPEGALRARAGDEFTLVRAIAFEPTGQGAPIERARAEDELGPGDTHYALSLSIEPTARLLVRVELLGTRTRTGNATEPGLLYLGRTEVRDLAAGETREVPVDLVDVVPDLSRVFDLAGGTGIYTLRWTAVAGADRYRLRERSGLPPDREFVTTRTDTSFAFPPSLARGGAVLEYRVRAEVTAGLTSAYSESVAVGLPQPTPPNAVVDLSAQSVSDSSVVVIWTAPSDGGFERVVSYDLRISRAAITEENFAAAERVPALPIPNLPGEQEGVFIQDLEAETSYFLALISRDDAGLDSPLSNLLEFRTLPPRDLVAPGAPGDLIARPRGETSITLRWVAPGDDGAVGQVAGYDIRSSLEPIDELNFDLATVVDAAPSLSAAGLIDSVRVDQLTRETSYWFTLRARDEAGNKGAIAPSVRVITPDLTPPAPITTLAARGRTANSVRLTWTATGDDGRIGTAASYDLRFSTTPISADNFADAEPVPFEGTPLPAGASESTEVFGLTPRTAHYFALEVIDESGNRSALSNVLRVTTQLEAPSDLASSLIEPRSIGLAWSYAQPDPEGFVLERHDQGAYERVALIDGGLREYLDAGLAANTNFTYRLRAFSGADSSASSNETSLTTGDEPPLCALNPDSLDFALVQLGADAFRRFTLRNSGGGRLEGTLPASCQAFTLLDAGPISLAAGETLDVEVAFHPTRVFDYGCSLDILSCGALYLHGQGDGPVQCRVSPPSIDFGEVAVGESLDRSYTIENLGGGTLEGSVFTSGCPDYAVVGGQDYSIGRLGSHQVTVRFAPTLPGPTDCAIANGTGPECSALNVAGSGIVCSAEPSFLDFGHVAEFADSTRSFTVTNESTTARVFTLEQSGSGCQYFAIGTLDIIFSLGPHASRTIDVHFLPPQATTYDCQVAITYQPAVGGAHVSCSTVDLHGVSP